MFRLDRIAIVHFSPTADVLRNGVLNIAGQVLWRGSQTQGRRGSFARRSRVSSHHAVAFAVKVGEPRQFGRRAFQNLAEAFALSHIAREVFPEPVPQRRRSAAQVREERNRRAFLCLGGQPPKRTWLHGSWSFGSRCSWR
jgi:hypothetical protein